MFTVSPAGQDGPFFLWGCFPDLGESEEVMEKVINNNIRIVSEIRVNRGTCQFHGVAGWSTGYFSENSYKSGFIQLFGNLEAGYLHFNEGGCHYMIHMSRGKVMKVLETLGYNRFEEFEVPFDTFWELMEIIKRSISV